MKILIVVDMQNDFVTGCLGTKEAQDIVEKVVDKVKNFDGEVYFTQDTHMDNYLITLEGKNLPVEHCIYESKGWEIIDELKPYIKHIPFIKFSFGCKNLLTYFEMRGFKDIDSIEIIGVCTDICVISNALLFKTEYNQVPILVDSSCCAGTTKEMHEKALDVMRSCQIEVE